MEREIVFILLFVVATAVAIGARRLHIPYTVALVLAGLGLGSMHVFEAPHLTKTIMFAVFLPGLIFEAAFHLEFDQFWRNRLATFSLAVPGVAAAIGITGLILVPTVESLQVVHEFSWEHALVLGALLAATDPIAVVGLFKTLGAPRRLSMLVEGESLLNDGTSIVLFALILQLVTGGHALTVRGLFLEFLSAVGVGMLVGGVIGAAISEVIKRVDDPMIEITLTTIAAYGGFVAAEQLHSSGVIATVTAGMLCGNYGARVGMSPSTRVAVETFWEYVAFALNSMVFLLIGFEVHISALLASWEAIAVAYLAVTASRAAVIALVSAALGMTRERIPRSWSVVLAWGGLRGALSMVLALGLARTFPLRELLITMTFGVVLLSLLVQGLTMAPLLRWLGVVTGLRDRAAYEFNRGRLQADTAAVEELDRMARTRFTAPETLEVLRDAYRARIDEAERTLRSLHVDRRDLLLEERDWLRRHLLMVEKERVIDLLHQGMLSQDAYERLTADIDTRLLELESGGAGDDADSEGEEATREAAEDASEAPRGHRSEKA